MARRRVQILPTLPTIFRVVYLQLRDVLSPATLMELEGRLNRLGSVRARGLRPETDSLGGWFEIVLCTPVSDFAGVLAVLAEQGIPRERVYAIRPIERGEGRTQAKQIELFAGVS